ncbi:MAG: hypothetical protein SNJ33_01995 [Rikenellaceae bacterium]
MNDNCTNGEDCPTCEQAFEENIQEIISDATPPTMNQHSEREDEVRDAFIE